MAQMEMFWSVSMWGPVPYSAHDIFNVEPKGMAHEISVLDINHEAIRQFDLCWRHFDFFFFFNGNCFSVKMIEYFRPNVDIQFMAYNVENQF